MNRLTRTLLGGAALSVLATAPVAAGPPRFHVQMLHGGRVISKTQMRYRCGQDITCKTYTFSISTSVPASDFRKRVNLVDTFSKFCSTASCHTEPKQRIKVPKKSKYGKVHATTVTTHTSGGERTFVYYGDAYKLTDKSGFGQTDTFVSSLKGEWDSFGLKYKVTMNLDVSVAIGTE